VLKTRDERTFAGNPASIYALIEVFTLVARKGRGVYRDHAKGECRPKDAKKAMASIRIPLP
jgi:hypothetical protein